MIQWLKCEVDKGMFDDERVISKEGLSFFVHKDLVLERNNRQGVVKVRVLSQNDQVWAVIPTEDDVIIEVSKEDLEACSEAKV